MLRIHLERVRRSKLVDNLIVATTTEPEDDTIVELCQNWGFVTSRGSADDVLDRFYQAVKHIRPEWVVRVTSDCPLLDPELVDAVIALAQVNDVDYATNTLVEHFPDGQDVEIFKFSALEKAWQDAKLKSEREHVTPYIRNHSGHKGGTLFSSLNFPCGGNYSHIRMTVDEPRDFELVTKLVQDLGTDQTWLQYTHHIIDNGLNQINDHITRNEGFIKSLQKD